MKKLLLFISLIAFFVVPVLAQTQTSPWKITTTPFKSFTSTGTFDKDEVYTHYFWVDTFAENLRIQLDLDTVSAGYLKVTTAVYGSLDNQNWVQLSGNVNTAFSGVFNSDSTIVGTTSPTLYTTITTAGATAATSSTLFPNVYYNYLKVVNTAIDSTQAGLLRYRILFDKK